MQMTTGKFILLRCFNLTLGRWGYLSALLKKILIRLLITGKKDKYVGSAGFFSWKGLES